MTSRHALRPAGPANGVRPDSMAGGATAPARDRAKHLFDTKNSDALAALEHLQPLCADLGNRATLKVLADADHSFHVPARSGRTDLQVRSELLDGFAGWAREVLGNTPRS